MNFNKFIAIDWSGAKRPTLPGIKAAWCKPGTGPPELIYTQNNWRRSGLVDWIKKEAASCGPLLVGFDFAFTFPYCDYGAYFPGAENSPRDIFSLWQEIEKICQNAGEFYGGPFYRSPRALFAEYICTSAYTGRYFTSRLRIPEKTCMQKYNTRPATVFKFVGPDNVGSGSVAGMRVLNYFYHLNSMPSAIWPLQNTYNNKLITFTEIFPRLYYIQADQDPKGWKDKSTINSVLSYFNSEPLPGTTQLNTEDEADAVISAAPCVSLPV